MDAKEDGWCPFPQTPIKGELLPTHLWSVLGTLKKGIVTKTYSNQTIRSEEKDVEEIYLKSWLCMPEKIM